MLSNGLVAASGALLAQYQGAADINMGRGGIVIGLAAVIIGEVVFGKIFRNFSLKTAQRLHRRSYLLYCDSDCFEAGVNTNDLKLITALIVAVFLAIPYWKVRWAQKFGKRGVRSA